MAKSAPNLSDVADMAGVSKSTVSRVLNNKLGNGFSVKEEVRLRVMRVAKSLNYRPNLIAQSLTRGQTRMISILGGAHALSNLGNIYQTVVNNVTGVLDNTSEGFDVTVDMSQHKPEKSELPAWRIDGAIILAKCTEETFNQLQQMAIPYVVVNGPSLSDGFSVIPNDVQGARLAIRHLLDLGHKRIAYASPPIDRLIGHSSITDRHDTYVEEMTAAGLEPMLGHDLMLKSPADFIKEMVIKNGATAILAYGHMGGLNLMQAAHTLGISVPEQLSLMCFCDAYANNVMSPGLTFIDLRTEDMGKVAAELLLEQIRNPEKIEHRIIKLDEKLELRDSTAKPFQG
jgi:LacI family transcriptional regulator